MAGLNRGSNAIYLSIADGQLVRQFKEPNKETVQRTTKTGKIVHEEFYRDIVGHITNFQSKDTDYGRQHTISILADGQLYMINMNTSRYSSSFLKALPNIDLQKEVKILPWSMIDKKDATKKITGITVYQNGVKLAPAFTKEEPNGMPEMVQVKIKGKLTWDGFEMEKFLEEVATDIFKTHTPISSEKIKEEKLDPLDAAFGEQIDDTLPF